MHNARWSIDLINRQKHRSGNGSKEKLIAGGKPKSIMDLVLEEQKQNAGKVSARHKKSKAGTNIHSKEHVVLNADEAQLDLALEKRGRIFKERVQKIPNADLDI